MFSRYTQSFRVYRSCTANQATQQLGAALRGRPMVPGLDAIRLGTNAFKVLSGDRKIFEMFKVTGHVGDLCNS